MDTEHIHEINEIKNAVYVAIERASKTDPSQASVTPELMEYLIKFTSTLVEQSLIEYSKITRR